MDTSRRKRTGPTLVLSLCLALLLALAACGEATDDGDDGAASDGGGDVDDAGDDDAGDDDMGDDDAGEDDAGDDDMGDDDAGDDDAGDVSYEGETVRIVVGYAAGGLYDTLARAVAQHLGEYLPGEPTVIVENMEGAGSLVALNATYHVEPQDGTVITTFDEGLVQRQLLGGEGAEFDAPEMHWIGSMQQSPNVLLVRTSLEFSSFQDLIDWTEDGNELVVATTNPGSLNHTLPVALIDALGLNARTVPGYGGAPEMLQALESAEADAVWLTVGSAQSAPFIEAGTVMGILTDAEGADATDYADAATADHVSEFLDDEGTALLETANAPRTFSRPYVAGPGVPAERVEALREAFAQVQADPRFEQAIEDANIPFYTPKDGWEVQQLIEDLFATPEATLERLRDLLN